MNRNTSIALLLVLASLASVKALDLKRHIRQPLTATKVATLTPLREEQILGPRELLEPADRAARRRRRRGLAADPRDQQRPLAVRAPHHRQHVRGTTRRGDAPVDTSIHLSQQGSSK